MESRCSVLQSCKRASDSSRCVARPTEGRIPAQRMTFGQLLPPELNPEAASTSVDRKNISRNKMHSRTHQAQHHVNKSPEPAVPLLPATITVAMSRMLRTRTRATALTAALAVLLLVLLLLLLLLLLYFSSFYYYHCVGQSAAPGLLPAAATSKQIEMATFPAIWARMIKWHA